MTTRGVCLFVLLALALLASAQQSAAPPSGAPRFDVVSIKINNSRPACCTMVRCSDGRWTANHIDVARLVTWAYGIVTSQVQGIPKWDNAPLHQYNIEATCPADVPASQTPVMLQSMLAERFGLAAHFETRTMRARTLELAKSGAKLKPTTGDCVQLLAGPPPPKGARLCGIFHDIVTEPDNHLPYLVVGVPMRMQHHVQAWSATIADFLQYYEGTNRPPTVDETGLTGKYDFDFSFEIINGLKDANGNLVNQSYKLQDALEKQLGLVFKQTKLPVPVLVIDRITPATPN